MKNNFLALAILAICLAIIGYKAGWLNNLNNTNSKGFALSSTSITNGKSIANEYVFNGFGCEGANNSPQLTWINAPTNTKSYAITAYDPDAPTGSGWWHWIVYNIPPSINAIPKAVNINEIIPAAKVARNDYGNYSYGGPCPPKGHGTHKYSFTVWALDTETLPVNKDASAALIGYYLNQNKLKKANITSTYKR